MMFSNGTGWGYWLSMALMMGAWVALLGAVAWAALSGVRRRESEDRSPGTSPRRELDRRLAAGEIDEEAYSRARRLIES